MAQKPIFLQKNLNILHFAAGFSVRKFKYGKNTYGRQTSKIQAFQTEYSPPDYVRPGSALLYHL